MSQNECCRGLRIYSVPEQLPSIYIAASGEETARLAGEIGDGYIGTSPEAELVRTFDASGGKGKPRYAQVTVCYAQDEAEARRMAFEIWPNSALRGELTVELPLPRHFEHPQSSYAAFDPASTVVTQAISQLASARASMRYIRLIRPGGA